MSNFWFCEIQKSDIPHPQKNRESFDDLQIFDWYPAIFCHFWGQKYTSKSIDFSIFGRDFGRNLDILPYYTDGFFSSIFDFSQKNRFSSQKVQKNWKSKNGVKTALTPLFKELWAIFGFVKFKNQISPPQKSKKLRRFANFQ